jgi:hypothetical protein
MTFGVDVAAAGALKQLENDTTNIQFDIPRAIQDITGLDSSGPERLHLLADFTITWTGVFNDEADKSHDVLKSQAGVRTATIIHSGQTLTGECLLTGYNLSRAAGGELTYSSGLQNADGAVAAWSA